jgi:beta-xylosidase
MFPQFHFDPEWKRAGLKMRQDSWTTRRMTVSRYAIARKSVWISAIFITACLLALLQGWASDQPKATPTWTDNFDGPALDHRWSWAREDPTHWSLSARPGYLRIITQTGGIYESTEKQKNLLLMPAPEGDFRIVTKCTIDPTENFQYAGLMVYQGRNNYVQINRAFTDGNSFNFDIEANGTPINNRVPASAATFYLRITKHGDTYTGDYSLDGEAWTTVGQGAASLVDPKVGIGAANNLPGKPQIPADFDFFKLYTDP